MIPALVSTRIGLTKPNSTMEAAICATCSGECVRAFFAYGTSWSVGQISMRRAIAGEMGVVIQKDPGGAGPSALGSLSAPLLFGCM